jgi:hypothetical protein
MLDCAATYKNFGILQFLAQSNKSAVCALVLAEAMLFSILLNGKGS